jgi:hypothetical protein
MLFLRALPAIVLLIFAIAATSCRGSEKGFSPSAGQDRLSHEGTALLVDHHQHLLSPAGVELINALGRKEKPVTGEQLVAMLDTAGIQRAVVLSDAYYFDLRGMQKPFAMVIPKFGPKTIGREHPCCFCVPYRE